ncbi:MAG: ABC transporter ATP-binding protein [Bacteroidales bacterium]|nr:ABC transporter ATP-binding protein [Bacteroidales bacterium]
MNAIEFDQVGKLYHLGTVGTGTLSHDLNRWWQTKVLHHEDPYLKVGETNDRAHKGNSDFVWALRDISFDVKQGEVVGIIGKNGAGKSTLLKLLSRVTAPTTGEIRVLGRIASLLEVGTGFHQEMTGRENIYMNGAIMGMTRAEISRKLDEIVDFAGVERYLDTPVKRYSSGMTVRLGFAVAAFLEPEILVVDEVLAVGDAEFQKKAIGKMQDVSRGEGRTVLFVSHNMAAVRKLCQRGVILRDGEIESSGTISEIVDKYLTSCQTSESFIDLSHRDYLQKRVYFNDFSFVDEHGNAIGQLSVNRPLRCRFSLKSKESLTISVRVALFDVNGNRVLAFDSRDEGYFFRVEAGGSTILECTTTSNLGIKPGRYQVNISVRQGESLMDHIQGVRYVNIAEESFFDSGRYDSDYLPVVLMRHEWQMTTIKGQ